MYIFIKFYTVLLFIHDLIECVISTYLCMVCSKGIHVCQNEKQRFCESELQSHPPPCQCDQYFAQTSYARCPLIMIFQNNISFLNCLGRFFLLFKTTQGFFFKKNVFDVNCFTIVHSGRVL